MKNKEVTSKLSLMYIIALVPLLLFGLYKNTIDLYNKESITLISALKPLALIFMSIAGSIIGNFITSYKKNKTISIRFLYDSRSDILDSLILAMILPLKSSPIIVFFITMIFSIIKLKLKINKIALMYMILFLINAIFKLNVFNSYTLDSVIKLDWIDLLLGWGNGGICSTNIILIGLGLIILSFNSLYKKDIAIASILVFLALGIIPNMLSGNYSEIFKTIFGYNALFTFVFIASNLCCSAYTTKGQILSGIVLGILTYFLLLLTPYSASIIGVIIINLLTKIFDRIFVIK